MYKKGKIWLVAPILFLGIVGVATVSDSNLAHADEVKQGNKLLVSEQTQVSLYQTSESSTSDQQENSNSEETAGEQESIENSGSGTNESSNGVEQSQEESKEEQTDNSESDSLEETTETTNPVEDETNESSESPTSESKEHSDVDSSAEQETIESTTNSETPEIKGDISPENTTNTEKTALKEETKAATTSAPQAAVVSIPIYRVYNPNSGEHLHTMNSNEKDYLVRLGWRYEGISMRVTNSGRQLYRIYNPNSGEHFFTLNANERNNLKKHGWRYEGVAWLTPWSGLPMYRVYNPNTRGAGAHHYTMLASERDSLLRAGWRNEGISWYTLGAGTPIQLNFLGINAQYIVNELNKHAGDKYYLGTPYRGLSVNDASQYMKPGSSMNCTGFVAKVIQTIGGNLSKITNISNNWGGLANAYNWRNALNPSVISYSFNSVADLLKSGKVAKGDIIYFEPNYSLPNYDCHIGFFWGNNSSDNKMWHSVPSTNRISSIYAPSGYSKVVVYKM